MATDMNIWKIRVKNAISGLADEALQRRAWLGDGPEDSSPIEEFSQVLDDVALEDYLMRDDTGLNSKQRDLGNKLLSIMRDELPFSVRSKIKAESLIDDARMINVRNAANNFLMVL